MRKLEVCCYTLESAIIAEKNGAHRIELCDNYCEGGTTPSFAAIKMVVEQLSIPVNVIIRPRGGDFLYSDEEFEVIKKEVEYVKGMNVNGVVVGFLKSDGEIDFKRTAEIVELAKPMEVTFHRAFDMSKNPIEYIEKLAKIGVDRILTSGTKKTAFEGLDLLNEMVKIAGEKISIMPGAGVKPEIIKEIAAKSNAKEFHASAKVFVKSEMKYFNKDISMGGAGDVNEYSKISVDSTAVRKMCEILEKL